MLTPECAAGMSGEDSLMLSWRMLVWDFYFLPAPTRCLFEMQLNLSFLLLVVFIVYTDVNSVHLSVYASLCLSSFPGDGTQSLLYPR